MLQTIVASVRRLAPAAMLTCLFVGATASDAAVYRTRWDPIFNTSFSGAVGIADVGWSGTATVTVSDNCLLGLPGVRNVGTGACTSASLDAVSLRFYDTNGTPLDFTDDITLGSVTWPPAGALPSISQVRVDSDPKVDGIDLLGPLFGSTGGIFADPYDIQLDFVIETPLGFTGPTLRLTSQPPLECELGCPVAQYDSATSGDNRPISTWSVPEPASFVLAAIALAALGLSRRRSA